MKEIYEIVMSHIRGMWRFRWRALLVAWLIAPVGWLAIFALPDEYEAKSSVYVNTESALRDLTKGLVIEGNLLSQLALVRQTMLSRENLEKVARETDLDLRVFDAEDEEELLEDLRSNIDVTGGERQRDGRNNLYTIKFRDKDRLKALAVVESLLQTFLEDTIGGKIQDNDDAQQFLKEQIAEYEERLATSERRLADFKRENIGLLPGAESDYFSRIQSEISARDNARNELNKAKITEAAILRQMAGESAVESGPTIGSSITENVYEQRLQVAQQELEEKLLRFTEKHPEVIQLRAQIARLEENKQEYYSALGGLGEASAGAIAANPVYQELRIALNDVRIQVAQLQAEIQNHDRKLAELQRLVDTVPKVEAELARLNRDYGVTQDQYETLVQRLEVARVTERRDQSEEVDFRIIDPPVVGFEPVAPRRFVLLSAVLLLSLGAGAALALFFDQLKPVFNNVNELQAILKRPVLGAVSRTWLQRHAVRRRLGFVSFAGGLVGLFGLFGFIIILNAAGLRFA